MFIIMKWWFECKNNIFYGNHKLAKSDTQKPICQVKRKKNWIFKSGKLKCLIQCKHYYVKSKFDTHEKQILSNSNSNDVRTHIHTKPKKSIILIFVFHCHFLMESHFSIMWPPTHISIQISNNCVPSEKRYSVQAMRTMVSDTFRIENEIGKKVLVHILKKSINDINYKKKKHQRQNMHLLQASKSLHQLRMGELKIRNKSNRIRQRNLV